jgi:hypothetical protein
MVGLQVKARLLTVDWVSTDNIQLLCTISGALRRGSPNVYTTVALPFQLWITRANAQSSRVDLSDTVIDRGTARTTTLAHRAANSALVVFIADSQPPCVGLRKFLEFVVV